MSAVDMSSPPNMEDAKRHAREVVERSKTSFGPGMRVLSQPRREAMFAVYAFCREIDDIADEPGDLAEKRAQLAEWRLELDRLYAGEPTSPTAVALSEPIKTYGLEKDEFLLLIEGMEMDAEGPIVAPPMETLLAYTRRVAGAVGRLSMPIFGAPAGEASDRFALALADALQLTNILRDIDEDADDGRCYLPREMLERHGIPVDTPAAILAHPNLAGVCQDITAIARKRFESARIALGEFDWRTVRPALMMFGVYHTYLDRLEERGWEAPRERVRLSAFEKAGIALKRALIPIVAL